MSTALYPLATLAQIERTPSREDGHPAGPRGRSPRVWLQAHPPGRDLAEANRKQVAVATAQILFHRFWFVTSMKQFGIGGALYLASKLEECPLRMRDLINVYDLLLQRAAHSLTRPNGEFKYAVMSYFGSTFYELKDALVVSEMQILKRLGFNVHVVLPYGSLINYLRVLGLTAQEEACTRAWGYLNDALQTPVYALYPVPTIVSAAILLTTRHLGIPLPSTAPHCWWELFDAAWEDVWSVCGHVMRLYRPRSEEEQRRVMGMVNKKEVRKWLEERESGAG
ncbi:cyclin-like protein [Mycena metata]|uniref:Cyclin-like protein n=1 Tax=Mycena metata TaxID=1033252 RepID=A0AAD7JU07_9AGAR|nr:cyclin-like protein [Mycena metata]